jgi:ankyrin repeat protein
MFVILLLYFMYCIYNLIMMFYFFFPYETEEHISIITILLTLKAESSTCIRRLFITRNINPFYVQRYTKKTLLMLSAQYGRHDFMKVLIDDYGADITEKDREGRDVVCFAVIHRHIDTLRFLIEECMACPNHAILYSNFHSQPGYRPLHLLCSQYGYPTELDDEILNLLLGAHANIHSQTKEGKTPLMLECQEFRRLYILYRLLKSINSFEFNAPYLSDPSVNMMNINRKINLQDNEGKTALHHLCTPRMLHTSQWKEKIQLLLDQNANPNIQDCKGWTPLMYFCEWDGDCTIQHNEEEDENVYLSIIEMLLQYDSDPFIKNRKSETVFDRLLFQLKHISTIHVSWDRKTKAFHLLYDYSEQRSLLTKFYYLYFGEIRNPKHPLFSFQRLLPDHQYEILQYLDPNQSLSTCLGKNILEMSL